MIFVTVGTHEQPFDRLIKEVDRLVENGDIQDEVIMQTGYCTYEPKYCTWKKFFSYDEMNHYVETADKVICHGGPATFMSVINRGKVPIVMPRREKYGEHVNDHQLFFVKKVIRKGYPIILMDNLEASSLILKKQQSVSIKKHNELFLKDLKREISSLIGDKS